MAKIKWTRQNVIDAVSGALDQPAIAPAAPGTANPALSSDVARRLKEMAGQGMQTPQPPSLPPGQQAG